MTVFEFKDIENDTLITTPSPKGEWAGGWMSLVGTWVGAIAFGTSKADRSPSRFISPRISACKNKDWLQKRIALPLLLAAQDYRRESAFIL